ncbi:hypothetical protein J6590_076814 [Homalodisca vitripennis]|nr:hypothetical protein J6590_076814 [Homalodisca vitripennis]
MRFLNVRLFKCCTCRDALVLCTYDRLSAITPAVQYFLILTRRQSGAGCLPYRAELKNHGSRKKQDKKAMSLLLSCRTDKLPNQRPPETRACETTLMKLTLEETENKSSARFTAQSEVVVCGRSNNKGLYYVRLVKATMDYACACVSSGTSNFPAASAVWTDYRRSENRSIHHKRFHNPKTQSELRH